MSKKDGKYVVFDRYHAVVVPPMNNHGDVKMAADQKPTSAGFFRIFTLDNGEIEVYVFGDSHSLDVESNPMDAAVLKMTLGLL